MAQEDGNVTAQESIGSHPSGPATPRGRGFRPPPSPRRRRRCLRRRVSQALAAAVAGLALRSGRGQRAAGSGGGSGAPSPALSPPPRLGGLDAHPRTDSGPGRRKDARTEAQGSGSPAAESPVGEDAPSGRMRQTRAGRGPAGPRPQTPALAAPVLSTPGAWVPLWRSVRHCASACGTGVGGFVCECARLGSRVPLSADVGGGVTRRSLEPRTCLSLSEAWEPVWLRASTLRATVGICLPGVAQRAGVPGWRACG